MSACSSNRTAVGTVTGLVVTADVVPLHHRLAVTMSAISGGWHARAMHLRIARHTEQLDELVRFYRDGLGLELIGTFTGHCQGPLESAQRRS